MDSTVQLFSLITILLALIIIALLSRRRRVPFALRSIRAYEVMPSFVGRSIESNRPMHISLGSAGIGGRNTVLAIASAELAYYMAYRASIGDVSPIITTSETITLPLTQDTLRRAYEDRRALRRYRPNQARWYPAGDRSLAFAAAITAMMSDDDISSNIMVGSYGPELALIADASYRRNVPLIAVSDQLEGQAVAFALSDEVLIGEEVFAAAAYLSDDPSKSNESVMVDALRWLLVAAIIIGFILSVVGG